jgi:hypothetical protein
MISINANSKLAVKKKKVVASSTTKKLGVGGKAKKGAIKGKATKGKVGGASRGVAPKLEPKSLKGPSDISAITSLSADELQVRVNDIFKEATGCPSPLFQGKAGIATPRAKSTTFDRGGAAADLALLAKDLGLIYVLKKCGILNEVENQILPNGIGAVFGNEQGMNPGGGLRKIASALSLALMGSMDSASASNFDATSTVVSDSRRGKTNAPEAREGCLLFVRALIETIGKPAEPYVVPLLAASFEESSSSSGFVREAAEDTAFAIVRLANPHAVPTMVCPVIFEALHSPEWRVKALALDSLGKCAAAHPAPISRLLPEIIPAVSGQVFDTKPQVTRSAASALLACCETNINPDVAPAVPAVVNAILKPAETIKAIDELKGTTFVASVDASTLSILCPILSRGLKDKMALNKRSCCIVIENMSRLVETPQAVAPFGPLLVPELKKVAENVQFDEIRDAALAALNALTKALGHANVDDALGSIMREENDRIEAEQKRIENERALEAEREEQNRLKEEEERRQWKEAMEAQRLLDKLALEEEEEKKAEEKRKKELAKKSTKSDTGKCQGCGLKKCKKTCLFNK